jgi:NitT/TauT family transport system permease protein
MTAEKEVGLGANTAPPLRLGRRGQWKEYASRIYWPLIALLALICAWEFVVRVGLVNPIVLPLPEAILAASGRLIQTAFLWQSALITLQETLLGFAIGAGFGFLLGVAISISRKTRKAIYPYAIALGYTPRVVFAPIFVTLFGFELASKVALAAAICFFPILINVVVGIENVDEGAKTIMRSYGASTLQMFRKLTLPSALPVIFAGLKVGMSLALIGAIVAEFDGGTHGLGVLLDTFNYQLDIPEVYSVVVLLSLLGLALYGVMEFLDRRIVFWVDR